MPWKLKIVKFNADADLNRILSKLRTDDFFSLTKTDHEISVVTSNPDIKAETISDADENWSAFRVRGQLDFSLVGILARISSALADEAVSIFAVSTFDTDYVLFKEDKLEQVKFVLTKNGYSIHQILQP